MLVNDMITCKRRYHQFSERTLLVIAGAMSCVWSLGMKHILGISVITAVLHIQIIFEKSVSMYFT